MKLELATKDYEKTLLPVRRAFKVADGDKRSAQLISAASKAIDAGRPDWEEVLTAVLAALIEDFGNEIAEDLGGELKSIQPEEAKWVFDPMSAAVRAWIVKHGAESITTILVTNLDDVKRIILIGVDENLGTAKISRNLRQFYIDRSPFKAMRVARTETSRAAGFGQREAAKQSGVVKTKKWLTSRDDRVRDEHVAMDGEEQPLDRAYSTGEMYPGEEAIMCRCAESYETRRQLDE